MSKLPPSNYANVGDIGEDLVAQWLESTGWKILHRGFSCRWGEIDIIAEYPHHTETITQQPINSENSILAFVEVKTRSAGSWDAGGRNAITAKKQTKLCRTAQIFLTKFPEKSNYSCRFDVALVFVQSLSKQVNQVESNLNVLAYVSKFGNGFKLLEYIPAAFDMSIMTE
jgi:putative endonuclease